jgi:hypothetical protein
MLDLDFRVQLQDRGDDLHGRESVFVVDDAT